MQRSVAEQTKTARVCGDITTNVAAAFGAEIQRDDEALLGHVLVQILKNASGLAFENACSCCLSVLFLTARLFTRHVVKALDLGHPLGRKDDFVKQWHATSHKTGIAALWDNRKPAPDE